MGGKGIVCMGLIFRNFFTVPVRGNGGNRHNFSHGKILYRTAFLYNLPHALMPQSEIFSLRRALPNRMHITCARRKKEGHDEHTVFRKKTWLLLLHPFHFSSSL